MHGRDGTSGVDWTKATEIGYALLLSPLFGFCVAAILLLVLKFVVRNPALYAAPEGNQPPPLWIRGILIAHLHRRQLRARLERRPEGHGPDHADPDRHRADRLRAEPCDAGHRQLRSSTQTSDAAAKVVAAKGAGYSIIGNPRPAVTHYVAARKINEGTYPSLAVLVQRHRRRRSTNTARWPRCRPKPSATPATTCTCFRSDPLPDEGQGERPQQGRGRDAQRLQGARSTARPSSSRPG